MTPERLNELGDILYKLDRGGKLLKSDKKELRYILVDYIKTNLK